MLKCGEADAAIVPPCSDCGSHDVTVNWVHVDADHWVPGTLRCNPCTDGMVTVCTVGDRWERPIRGEPRPT